MKICMFTMQLSFKIYNKKWFGWLEPHLQTWFVTSSGYLALFASHTRAVWRVAFLVVTIDHLFFALFATKSFVHIVCLFSFGHLNSTSSSYNLRSLLQGPPASQPVSETRAAPKPAAAAPAEVKAVQPQPPKPKTGTDDLLGLGTLLSEYI
jgi:hypothetical protein